MLDQSTDRHDYEELVNLASSRNIQVVEAQGLERHDALRFNHADGEWIAIDSSLSISEKIRALGFMLENNPGGTEPGQYEGPSPGDIETVILSLRCPRTRDVM